jgi:hypothetical protein
MLQTSDAISGGFWKETLAVRKVGLLETGWEVEQLSSQSPD